MPPRHSRRLVLVAALLVLPLLALSAGLLASHEGHGGDFDRNCLACRWAADAVADAAAPVGLPQPVAPVGVLTAGPLVRVPAPFSQTASSRGPPLG